MKRRRWTAALAALTMVALAACGGASNDGASEEEPTDTGAAETTTSGGGGGEVEGTLTIFAIPNARDGLDAVIPQFEEENPGVTVEASYAEVDSMISTLRTQLSAGTAADVFSAWPGNGTPGSMENLVPGGYLMDLTELELSDRIPSGFDSVTMVDGRRYVLPMSIGAIGAIYNEQAVEAVGATIPTTWSEVLEFCETASAAGKSAFALGAQTLWNTQLINYALTPTLVYGPNPDFDEKQAAGEVTFAESEWVTAFEKYVEMLDSGCFQDDPLGTSYEVATELVGKGDALAIVSVTSTFAAVEANAEEGTTFNMFALPATDNADDTWMPAGASGGIGANANAKNPEAARAFMEFLGRPDIQAQFADAVGQLPMIGLDTYDVPESLSVPVQHVEAGTIHPYIDQLWPNPEVQAAHFDAVQLVLGGQSSIEEALAMMDAAYQNG